MKRRSSVKGVEALFAASFTYAFTGVLVRWMASMWGNTAQVAVRYLLAFLLFLLYGYLKKIKFTVPRAKWPYAVSLGISFVTVVLCFTVAIERTTLANTLFTFYAANMIGSFILGSWLFKEDISSVKLLAIIIALAGLSLYAGEIKAGDAGILLSLTAGVFGAVSNALSKYLTGINRNTVLSIQYGVGTILAAAVTLFSGETIVRTASFHGTAVTIVFALVLVAAANLSLYGFQHFDVNVGAVIMSMEIVFGALLGRIVFGEVPLAHELAGGCLIFIASVLSGLEPAGLLKNKTAPFG